LNCQNWDISQSKPEETKDPRGEPLRLTLSQFEKSGNAEVAHLTVLPEDVANLAGHFQCASIAYTYSEPIVWFEYMLDTAKARASEEDQELLDHLRFDPGGAACRVVPLDRCGQRESQELQRGDLPRLEHRPLEPILATLKTLKREGVWFEVTNLVVPTYTDKPEMIRRMCDWLVSNIGPDYPLHFSRFHPDYKLRNLPPTPVDILLQAARNRPLGRTALRLRRKLPANCRRRQRLSAPSASSRSSAAKASA